MNRWFYRAVGVASGAFLLGGGVAHAGPVNEDRSMDPQVLLADLFKPIGQLHLAPSIDEDIFGARKTPDIVHMTNKPGAGKPEVLSGLIPNIGANGKGGGLLSALTDGGGLLSSLTDGGLLGSLGSLTSVVDPLGLVRGLTGGLTDADRSADGLPGGENPTAPADNVGTDSVDPASRGTAVDGTGPRVLLRPAATSPVNGAIAQRVGQEPGPDAGNNAERHAELLGGLPLTGGLLGPKGRSDQFVLVGGDMRAIPIVGGLIGGSGLDRLPVVGSLLNQSGPGALPVIGNLPIVGNLTQLLGGGLTGGLTDAVTEPLSAVSNVTATEAPLARAAVEPGRHRAAGEPGVSHAPQWLPMVGAITGADIPGA